jgi:hypothetical protein
VGIENITQITLIAVGSKLRYQFSVKFSHSISYSYFSLQFLC